MLLTGRSAVVVEPNHLRGCAPPQGSRRRRLRCIPSLWLSFFGSGWFAKPKTFSFNGQASVCVINQRSHSHRPGFSFQAIVSEIRTWQPRWNGHSRSARRSTRWLSQMTLKSAPTFSVCRSSSSCDGSDLPENCASLTQTTYHSFVHSADRISRISRSWNSALGRLADIWQWLGTWRSCGTHCCAATAPRCAFWTRTISVSGFDVNLLSKVNVNMDYFLSFNIVPCFGPKLQLLISDWDNRNRPTVDIRLPALRHFTYHGFTSTDLLADSVELLTVKAFGIGEFLQLATADRFGIHLLSASSQLGARRIVPQSATPVR